MADYKPQERQELEELYRKQNVRIVELEQDNKNLKDDLLHYIRREENYREENKKLKETIKDHQLYEEKLEHRIIEFEELLHGE